MGGDMRAFVNTAHAALDEREKINAKLRRLEFDHKSEGANFQAARHIRRSIRPRSDHTLTQHVPRDRRRWARSARRSPSSTR